MGAPPPPPSPTEVISPHAIVPVQTTGASDDHMQIVEKMLRQLRVAEGMDVWDGFDSAPITPTTA